MKKILVVSENVNLSKFLLSEMERQNLNELAILKFCYTSYNKAPEEMIKLGADEINLKKKETVDHIIEKFDCVFSLHCKQIFPSKLVNNLRCINFHPGYNPFNRGWYPQVFSILNNKPIGSTIHVMDEKIDNGKIIAQKKIDVDFGDTSLELYNKIIECEKSLIRIYLKKIINEDYKSTYPFKIGNYNDIKKFKKLCKLNLESKDSLYNHINLLKALSHGEFKNAYAVINNKKYFIKISIVQDKEN